MQRHWLVTLQNLSSTGRSWNEAVPKALLQDKSCGSVNTLNDLSDDVHWQLSVHRQDKTFRLEGTWKTTLKRQCSRCNCTFDHPVTGSSERLFQFSTTLKHEPNADENTSAYELIERPGEVNLIDVLREDVWLAWQADVICSASCQGLCQGCGVNLNTDTCQCKQDDSNNPFAALRSMKLDG